MNGERNMLKKIKNKKLRFVVITLLGVTALLNFYSGIDSLFNLLKITIEITFMWICIRNTFCFCLFKNIPKVV